MKHEADVPAFPGLRLASKASSSGYDTLALKERAGLWRGEAGRTHVAAMRAFCLDAAEKCEQRIHRSLFTPIICESPYSKSDVQAGNDFRGAT